MRLMHRRTFVCEKYKCSVMNGMVVQSASYRLNGVAALDWARVALTSRLSGSRHRLDEKRVMISVDIEMILEVNTHSYRDRGRWRAPGNGRSKNAKRSQDKGGRDAREHV